MTWQNRIVGYGEEAPDQLMANPDNWRVREPVPGYGGTDRVRRTAPVC